MRPTMLQTGVIGARRQSWRVKMKIGNRRVVLAWCALRVGYRATSLGHRSAWAAASSSSAAAVNVSAPTSTVITGLALRLWYQPGWAGDPPLEATTANLPPPNGK